ncbi:hypothetical protein G6O69_04820 [Pseudenhygromyxa sp. WMMC2535]|uniref:hypothetical protein n=1 Tax=Pseudenhygromyxa sp. WMMC2535 TaxID=2712867 RepID=UPI001553E668|nr:hypothetical protein [Pseudenhygromyxa sp. WMMC2535]NVB37142.1 hypothetical protein [Pseudenhygromyxa sp. WMMC2535]
MKNLRHIVDESGLQVGSRSPEKITECFEELLARLERARERGEAIATSSEFYDAPVTAEHVLHEVLYTGDSPIEDRDLKQRLSAAFDKLLSFWDEDEALLPLVEALDVFIGSERVFAPSLALAHAFRASARALGCLNLRSSGRKGQVPVSVGGRVQPLHFVVDEASQRALFREAIEIEDMDEGRFAENAASAFPDLSWVEGVWDGLKKFRRPYGEHRRGLTRHLAALDDHGAALFDTLMSTHPEEIGARLGALGVTASDENGRTKQDKQARKERTRRYEGEDHLFWWHTKLRPETDRIHFLWRPSPDGGASEIVIGLFTDHCHTPD